MREGPGVWRAGQTKYQQLDKLPCVNTSIAPVEVLHRGVVLYAQLAEPEQKCAHSLKAGDVEGPFPYHYCVNHGAHKVLASRRMYDSTSSCQASLNTVGSGVG